MLVKVEGFETPINIVNDIEGVLVDSNGTMWYRNAKYDKKDEAAAFTTDEDLDPRVIMLDRNQLKRVCKGTKAIQEITTVDEARAYAGQHYEEWGHVVDQWNNQQIREIMMKAEETGRSMSEVAGMMERKARAQIVVERAIKEEKESHREATEKPEETHVDVIPPKSPSRKRTQEKAKRVAFGEMVLTERQVEFLRGLPAKDAFTAEDAPEGFSKMAVGAMISTLREKGVISTGKTTMTMDKGKRVTLFKFTDVGDKIHGQIINGGNDNA